MGNNSVSWGSVCMYQSSGKKKNLNNDDSCAINSWKKMFYFIFTAGKSESLIQPNFTGVSLGYLLLYIQCVSVHKNKNL